VIFSPIRLLRGQFSDGGPEPTVRPMWWLHLRSNFDSVAIRPRYDHSTTYK